MANYMAEVAKILGVEIGEYFEINRVNGYYFLCYEGLVHNESGNMVNGVLNDLLVGKLTIKRKPWKPNDKDVFWSINAVGNVDWSVWIGATEQLIRYKIGNCYRTEAEAVANRDKWISFYASDKVLEV